MPNSSAAALPEDDDGLARLVADSAQPIETRRRAFEALIPTIDWVAKRVSIRFGGQWRGDIVTDAPADIWDSISRFPHDGRFVPWCHTVLRNRWLDTARRAGRWRHLETATEPSTDAGLQAALERAIDSSVPFGPEDILLIAGWPPRDRLVLLSLAGLWRKVPSPEWGRWILEHRERYGKPGREPFPPKALADCERLADRNEALSAALKITRNTLSQVLNRGKFRLLALRYVRDRVDRSGETRR